MGLQARTARKPERWHIGHIRNTTLRRAAIVLWFLVGLPVWMVAGILVAVEEAIRGFGGECQDFCHHVAGAVRRWWPRQP